MPEIQIEKFRTTVANNLLEDPVHTTPSAKNLLKYMKYNLKDLGLTGGRFFTVSYGFVGSVSYT